MRCAPPTRHSRSYQSHPPEIANANRTSAPNESAGINIIKNHHRMTIVLELIISLGGAAKQLSETLELTEHVVLPQNVLSAPAEPTETHRIVTHQAPAIVVFA